jgi:hypothetical protein
MVIVTDSHHLFRSISKMLGARAKKYVALGYLNSIGVRTSYFNSFCILPHLFWRSLNK